MVHSTDIVQELVSLYWWIIAVYLILINLFSCYHLYFMEISGIISPQMYKLCDMGSSLRAGKSTPLCPLEVPDCMRRPTISQAVNKLWQPWRNIEKEYRSRVELSIGSREKTLWKTQRKKFAYEQMYVTSRFFSLKLLENGNLLFFISHSLRMEQIASYLASKFVKKLLQISLNLFLKQHPFNEALISEKRTR